MRKSLIFVLFLIPVLALAGIPVAPFQSPTMQFFDSNGKPLSGGKLYFYAAGTTTPIATYTDATGTVQNPNPITLNASGRGTIWLKASAYKVVAKDAAGVTQWTVDGVNAFFAQSPQTYTVATLPASASKGQLVTITDGNGQTCSVGGGSTVVTCQWDGSSWQAIYSGYSLPDVFASQSAASPKAGKFTDLTANTVAAGTTNGVYNASMASGSDIGAKINTIAQGLCSAAGYSDPVQNIPYSFSAGTIKIPPGAYTYSTPVVLPCPMILDQTGAKLNYTGTGTALTLGPTGLSETGTTPIHEGWYIVRGGMFTGGQSATHAILINKGVVNTITEGVKYYNYGTNGNAAEYVSGNNWVVRSVSDDFQNDSVSVGGSWFEAAPDANTQIHIVNNFYRGGGAAGNFGAKLTGVGSSISHSQGMSGGNPNLAIVQHGHSVVIDDVYMECSTGCIKYGTAADLITGLTIQNSYFNLHQNGYVLFPGHANTGLQGMKFVANKVNGVPTNGKLIQQTAIGGQSNNQAYGNLTYAYNDFSQVFDAAGIIHDQVGTVASWSGSQGEQFTLPNASWIAFYDASGVPTSLVSLEGDNNLYLRGHATEKRIIIKADPVGSIDALFSPGNLTFNAHMYVNGYLDVQTGTQLRGYSDSGTTKKFTLDASDGTADFVTGYKVNGTAGITKTVTRQKNGGGTCTETYTGGILTASDC